MRAYVAHRVTIDESPRVSDVTVDQQLYSRAALPLTVWWENYTVHLVSLELADIIEGDGSRYAFSRWSDGVSTNPRNFTVTSPLNLVAVYKKQFYLDVRSTYGDPEGEGWYDANESAMCSVPSSVDYGNGTRRIFVSWTGDLMDSKSTAHIVMDSAKKVETTWRTQFLVNMTSSYGEASGGGWYAPGTSATVSITPVLLQKDFLTNYVFEGWVVAGTIVSTSASYSFAVIGPTSLTAGWKTELNLLTVGAVTGGVILLILAVAFFALRRSRYSLKPGVSPSPTRDTST